MDKLMAIEYRHFFLVPENESEASFSSDGIMFGSRISILEIYRAQMISQIHGKFANRSHIHEYVHTYIVYLGVHMLCVHIYIHMCIHIYIYPHIYVLIRTYLNSYMHTCFFFVGDNYITNGKPKCYLKPHKIGPLVIVKLVISF